MARGDTFYVNIPTRTGYHYSVVLKETPTHAIVIFGQADAHPGAFAVDHNGATAAAFAGKLDRITHFQRNNIAMIPLSSMPKPLGQVTLQDLPGFVKAAKQSLVDSAPIAPMVLQ